MTRHVLLAICIIGACGGDAMAQFGPGYPRTAQPYYHYQYSPYCHPSEVSGIVRGNEYLVRSGWYERQAEREMFLKKIAELEKRIKELEEKK